MLVVGARGRGARAMQGGSHTPNSKPRPISRWYCKTKPPFTVAPHHVGRSRPASSYPPPSTQEYYYSHHHHQFLVVHQPVVPCVHHIADNRSRPSLRTSAAPLLVPPSTQEYSHHQFLVVHQPVAPCVHHIADPYPDATPQHPQFTH